MSIDKILAELDKDFGSRAFRASEAPPVKVLSTGIPSLDVATGIGGWPIGTLIEVFGRESSGKTAMSLYTMGQAHLKNGFSALINLESSISNEGWLKWVESMKIPGFDPKRVVIVNPEPGTESLKAFGMLISSGAFDVIVYDSIGAMSTDKELRLGESKQAYGQSALVTQLIKQAANWAAQHECVPMVLNQIRDEQAGNYVIEKSPGGHAKDHFATLRVHLKPSWAQITAVDIGDGSDAKEKPYFKVNARIVKNKVGSPRRRAQWNFWDYESPDGIKGIDVFQSLVDVALQNGAFEKRGAWYQHELFPGGKLNGGVAVTDFLRATPDVAEKIRRDVVMKVYNTKGNIMEENKREVLTDAVL